MKKTLITLILVNWQIIKEQKIMDNSIYQFTVEDVDGEAFDFSCLEGKKIMIVNTASRCGLTYQYIARGGGAYSYISKANLNERYSSLSL